MKRFVKILLIVVIAILVVFIVVNLFAPSKMVIEKSRVFNVPPHEVYGLVADFKHYDNWNYWQQTEPSATSEVTGSPGLPGHKYEWKGEEIGHGYLEIVNAMPYNTLQHKLVFMEPWESEDVNVWTFEEMEDGTTKVTWLHDGAPMSFPMRFINIMLQGQLEEAFEKSFDNIEKMLVEKNAEVTP